MECMDGGPNEQDALTGDTVTVNCIYHFSGTFVASLCQNTCSLVWSSYISNSISDEVSR